MLKTTKFTAIDALLNATYPNVARDEEYSHSWARDNVYEVATKVSVLGKMRPASLQLQIVNEFDEKYAITFPSLIIPIIFHCGHYNWVRHKMSSIFGQYRKSIVADERVGRLTFPHDGVMRCVLMNISTVRETQVIYRSEMVHGMKGIIIKNPSSIHDPPFVISPLNDFIQTFLPK